MSSLFPYLCAGFGAIALLILGSIVMIRHLDKTNLYYHFQLIDVMSCGGKLLMQCRPHQPNLPRAVLAKRARRAGYEIVSDFQTGDTVILTKIAPVRPAIRTVVHSNN